MNKLFYRVLVVVTVLLLDCTILSGFVQEQMTVEVSTVSLKYDHAAGGSWIPADAVRWEGESPFLYTVEEGFGLTAGHWAGKTFTAVMDQDQEEDRVLIPSQDDSDCILYASRPFAQGERVMEESSLETASDQILLWLPLVGDASFEGESASGDGGTYWLVEYDQVSQPFFQERELAKLVPEEFRSQGKLVSMKDFRAFLDALPWISLAVVLVAGSLVGSVLLALSLGAPKGRKTALICGTGCGTFLVVLLWLVSWLDLPSSLLSVENLFDLNHYGELFTWVKNGLAAFESGSACGEFLRYVQEQQAAGWGVLAVGGILLMAAVALWGIARRKSRTSAYKTAHQRKGLSLS